MWSKLRSIRASSRLVSAILAFNPLQPLDSFFVNFDSMPIALLLYRAMSLSLHVMSRPAIVYPQSRMSSLPKLQAIHVPSPSAKSCLCHHYFIRTAFLCLDESRAHQLVDVSALHLALVLCACLEQHSQYFNRRVEAQRVCSSPPLDSGDANAGLQDHQ